jgi:hypothetical protein
VAAQKAMAITESIVMNSNILIASSRSGCVYRTVSTAGLLLRARVALRSPPAISATKTVAVQKTMAMTESIVMNSNILITSFRLVA